MLSQKITDLIFAYPLKKTTISIISPYQYSNLTASRFVLFTN